MQSEHPIKPKSRGDSSGSNSGSSAVGSACTVPPKDSFSLGEKSYPFFRDGESDLRVEISCVVLNFISCLELEKGR